MRKKILPAIICFVSLSNSAILKAQDTLYAATMGNETTGCYGQGFYFNTSTNTITSTSSTGQYNTMGKLAPYGNKTFYTITYTGGTSGKGAIVLYNANSNTFSTKVNFSGANGRFPFGNLTPSGGLFYGTTVYGGSYDEGTLYSYNTGTSVTTLVNFHSGINGKEPRGGLIQASNGKFYGVTSGDFVLEDLVSGDVPTEHGTIYEFDPSTNSLSTIYNFGTSNSNTANGLCPYNSLLQASNGKLYGMTPFGGANNMGTLFSYNLSTGNFGKKIDFSSSMGGRPLGSLIQATNHKLYGVTTTGGTHNAGTLFEYDISANTLTVLVNFSDASGSIGNDGGSLFQASDGLLYGCGASANDAYVFSYNISTGVLAKRASFTCANGSVTYLSQFTKSSCTLCRIVKNHITTNEALSSQVNVQLLTNPVHQTVRGIITSKISGNGKIRVVSLQGEIVSESEIKVLKGYNSFQISVNNNLRGAYFIQVSVVDKQSKQLLILQ